jgi:hypothetical protein
MARRDVTGVRARKRLHVRQRIEDWAAPRFPDT